MATQTKSVSGQTTTYVITDEEGSTCTVAVTQLPGSGFATTITTSGNFHQDGMQALVTLTQLTSTNLLP